MAYDQELARRVRAVLAGEAGVTEQAMFGGLAFLVGGRMAVAVSGEGGLMVRVDPAEAEALVATAGARPVEMRGRPMRGWVRVVGDALRGEARLAGWVGRVACVRSLPADDSGGRRQPPPASGR